MGPAPATQIILLYSVLSVSLIGCAGPALRVEALARERRPTGPCPTIDSSTAPVPDTGKIRIRDGPLRRVPYVNMLIDGYWFWWNDPQDGSIPPRGPDLDPNDVKRVEVLQPAAAAQAYGTCPGIGLIIITTKSKKWRPFAPDSQ